MTQQSMTFNEWHVGFERLHEAYKDARSHRHICAAVFADLSLDPCSSPELLNRALNEYSHACDAHKAAYAAIQAFPRFSREG